MITFKRVDLFPTSIYKTKINPSSYDKETVITKAIENYNLNPDKREYGAPEEEYHTTHLDDNQNVLDLNSLRPVYGEIVDEFMDGINKTRPFEYIWNVVNLSMGKNRSYRIHDHLAWPNKQNLNTQFVMVHYVSYDKSVHHPTLFHNPLKIAEYEKFLTINKVLMPHDVLNSTYFETWKLDTEEDDVVIFPAYLKHSVPQLTKNDKFRIITSTQIMIRYKDEEL